MMGEHMKKHIGRILILSVLIMGCIWQTITLWLGDMSGHNFFGGDVASYETSYLYPKEIWSNINGSIYKIEGNNDEEAMRYKLLYELFEELKKENVTVELSPKISYADLLSSTPGIIYEYGTSLTIDEMMGQSMKVLNSKSNSIKINDLYIDMSEKDRYKAYVYFIDKSYNVSQKVTINNLLDYHSQAMEYYKDVDQVGDIKTYQASLLSPNDSEIFAGNLFYPLNNQAMPIYYKKVVLKPHIEDIDSEKLENHVNDLFKNPTYKTKIPVQNGVTFSDNLNVSVMYNEVGTLEFKKTAANDTEKSSSVERISKINTFIKESKAIPDFLKRGIYLNEIKTDEETGETHYLFGYQYDNFDVILSEQAQAELEVSAFLELVIKNSEIIRGKWVMLKPVSESYLNPNQNLNFHVNAFQKESTEAISDILEQVEMEEKVDIEEEVEMEEDSPFELEDLECAYIIEDIREAMQFGWVGYYKENPILVNEKIDNE